MNKIDKLSTPITILLASFILGGFIYATQISKQNSIEKQQNIKIANEKMITDRENFQKSLCSTEAEQSAVDYYKSSCGEQGLECKEGRYLIASYEGYYKMCLQKFGLKP